MCSKVPLIALLSFTLLSLCNGQENIQTRIPNSLAECYERPEILERDTRLPMNMNILIELIRKIEDDPNDNRDMRQLAISLLHRFKLDGIERASGIYQSSKVLPFSPSGYQFSKHRILLSRLIPNTGSGFPNNTLTALERCTLHFMLSTSIETRVRGDESVRCNQLAQFRAMRVPRDVFRSKRNVPIKNNYIGDMEFMEELEMHQRRQAKKLGRYQAADEEENVDERAEIAPEPENENEDEFVDPTNRNGEVGLVDVASNSISQCPVENGVVRTMWGEISAGSLIAGIAAGLEPQRVMTRDLLALSRGQKEQYKSRQTQAFAVDNKWAATLAGDLAEVALLQGPVTQQVSVGAPGAWNRTLIPQWYFLSQRERLEMTDAEIRGGLDGLILGTKVVEFRGRASQLKLSQLLDMYYSQRGVFTSNVRSCDRREHFTSVAPMEEMRAQTIAFSSVLDREMQMRVTLNNDAITAFSEDASQALSNYIPQSLNDLSCGTTSLVPNDQTVWRTATELFIYVDASWPFKEIQPIVSYLIENLDVNRFGTSYTLLNARDASIIINTTNSISTFYTSWNSTNYQHHPPGLDLPLVLKNIREHSIRMLNSEQSNSSVGGRSYVALVIPQSASPNDADSNEARNSLFMMREQFPDLLLLILADNTVSRFESFVIDRQRDLFSFQRASNEKENVPSTVNPIIRRIQEVPRRIINHRCGPDWQSSEFGQNTMTQFVERGGINFYRLHPNYFFLPGTNRKIIIQGQRQGLLSVCSSRTIPLPRANSSNPDQVECRQINTDHFTIDVSNVCADAYLIKECWPVYVSVEGIALPSESSSFSCNERDCRFPDSIRYTVQAENLGCFSGAARLLGTLAVVLLSVIVVLSF